MRRSGVADPPLDTVKLALEASFRTAVGTVAAAVGIAIARRRRTRTSLGGWWSGVAWSTIKVPLAIAAMRRAGSGELAVKAITESDNRAAEQLWSRLAIRRTRHGRCRPSSPMAATRPPWSSHGDFDVVTRHSAKRSGPCTGKRGSPPGCRPFPMLACDRLDAQPQHRSPLGAGRQRHCRQRRLGSGGGGDYLVRQFAIVPIPSGHVGVALAAEVHDGAFETGVAVLNALSDWLLGHLAELTDY